MLIGKQKVGASPDFEISRGEDGVTLDFSYKPDGHWVGSIDAVLGDASGTASGTGDAPFELSLTAKLEDGVTTEGQYVLFDMNKDETVTFDFTVTTYSSAGVFAGTEAADYVFGSELIDSLSGGAGEDVFRAGAGADTLHGGDGADDLRGGADNDLIMGDAGDDRLVGNRGDDMLSGGQGDDVLSGRWGADTLTGGAGNDIFLFSTGLGATEVDLITDFATGEDKISLGTDVFAALDGLKGLKGDQFAVTEDGVATSSGQRIIYNSTTGELFYDADGSGAAAAILFAKLAPGTEIDKDDFLLG